MNLIYDAPRPPKVLIDTTVLCGAIRMSGVNRTILQSAQLKGLFQPVFSKVGLFEFLYKTTVDGLGRGNKKVIYEWGEAEEFLDLFVYPLLKQYSTIPVNSIVGRYTVEAYIKGHRPIGEVLVELSGCDEETARKIVANQEMKEPLQHFDPKDFYVWVTAIQEECDYILTSNHRRFPSEIGPIKRIHPSDFYEHLSNPFMS
ncbi:PIN domain-containing protein [Neobacillus sp. YIM B02564]|uniref:PIN domain-containing protein n=1 Tax=Neobacillus paridis TaxID=2803862 RepID=A0ABS1TL45_9BACI|nr:PIN domain-containing protein [Neobacillus paridis]MBL4952044.1 PIN domain-containing protein [Neobacillus paridis]